MNFFRERKYGTPSQSFMKINSMCENDATRRFKSNPDFTTDGTKKVSKLRNNILQEV